MRERIERSLPFILVVVVLLISNALLSDTKKKEEPILHECGDYRYRLKEDGTAMITAYLNDEKWPFIPAELDGHAVTGIGDRAFSGNFITDVKIPNSITYTEGNPFAGGENSPGVIIAPDHPTLEIVDDVLFNKVEKTLVAYMRRGESGYQIPEGIKSIGNSAFIEKRCAYKRPYSGRRNEHRKLRVCRLPLSFGDQHSGQRSEHRQGRVCFLRISYGSHHSGERDEH